MVPYVTEIVLTNVLVRNALVGFKYPSWAINKVQSKVLNSNLEDGSNNNPQNTGNNSTHQHGTTKSICRQQQPSKANNNPGTSRATSTNSRFNSTMGYIVIPYTKRLMESFKHTCGKYGIQSYSKGNTTIKQVLMKPKDQYPKEKEEWGNLVSSAIT